MRSGSLSARVCCPQLSPRSCCSPECQRFVQTCVLPAWRFLVSFRVLHDGCRSTRYSNSEHVVAEGACGTRRSAIPPQASRTVLHPTVCLSDQRVVFDAQSASSARSTAAVVVAEPAVATAAPPVMKPAEQKAAPVVGAAVASPAGLENFRCVACTDYRWLACVTNMRLLLRPQARMVPD